MSKKTKIIIISVVCSVVVAALALGLGLGLGLNRGGKPGGTQDPNGNKCSHAETVVFTTDATCTESGSATAICVKCGKTVKTETLPKLGHNYGSWKVVTNPTEQKDGAMRRVCKNDGAHYETKAVPRLQQGAYSVQEQPGDCNQYGKRVYSSAEYGTFTVLLPKAHDYANARAESSKNSDGATCNFLVCPDCGEKIASLNLKYELLSDDTYKLVGRESAYNDNDLVIPAYVDLGDGLKPVTAIGSDVFNAVWWLKSVTIPETITTFGAGAFNMGECERNPLLSKIYFNAVNCDDFNGRNWVFLPWASGTTGIELVVGPQVTRIPANMFFPLVTDPSRTTLLNKVTFATDGNLKEIGSHAFYKTKLTELDLPDSLETIGDYAFYGSNLTDVQFNDSLTTLGDWAFADCKKLETVTFGAGLKYIGNDCFNYCGSLLSVDLSHTQVESVGVDAFKNCEKLQTVKLSGVTTTLGDSAFENCSALTSCELGSSLITLGNRAFYGCGSLTAIRLPQPLKNIGNSAFENCVKLAFVQFDATNCNDLAHGNRAFANAGKDVALKVVIGASVQNLPARLWYSSADASVNVTISQLLIDWNLESVGTSAFLGANIGAAYFNSDLTSWNSISIGSGNSSLTEAMMAFLREVSK